MSGIAPAKPTLATSNFDAGELHNPDFVPLSLLTDNLWDRLGESFEFSDINNARIDRQVEFLQAGLASMHRKLANADPYLFHIADKVKSAGIPLDIALLPFVESAFDPLARSGQGALGLWQFIPATATHYGLTVEPHLDQRQDVIASTNAAIHYLSDLKRSFKGDWLLALAAYNTGPGNVRKAIRQAVKRGVEPTYWNLQLSTETSEYIPRLIATTKMISDPEKYRLKLPPIADQKKIDSVTIGRRISLQQVAELTSAPVDELFALNPALPSGLTPIYGPHRITLPVNVATRFKNRIKQLKHLPLLERQTQLEMVRRNISNPLLVDKEILSNSGLLDQIHATTNAHFETHTVRHGDTLWSLAKKSGVAVDTLRSWNNLAHNDPIKKGDTLKIAYAVTDPDSAGLMNYRVNPSDSLSAIATKFDLAITDITRWNSSVRNTDHIQAGQVLRIPTYPSSVREY